MLPHLFVPFSDDIQSRHLLGGISAVVFYFCIHSDATRIHTQPAARDSIAFPFIFAQVYFLSAWMEQHNQRYTNEETDGSENDQIRTADDDADDDVNLIQVINVLCFYVKNCS